MHQFVAASIVLFVLVGARGTNWGEAMGAFTFAPVATFFVLYTIVYFAMRWLRGRDALASYTASRLNYFVAAFVVLSVLGQVARDASPA